MTTYYQFLGVNKDASSEEIRKAYKRLAKIYHPDRRGGNEDAFKLLSEAYRVLNDDNLRKQYDKENDYDTTTTDDPSSTFSEKSNHHHADFTADKRDTNYTSDGLIDIQNIFFAFIIGAFFWVLLIYHTFHS